MTVHKLLQEYDLEFQPYFDTDIFLVIHEAELMEQLGEYDEIITTISSFVMW